MTLYKCICHELVTTWLICAQIGAGNIGCQTILLKFCLFFRWYMTPPTVNAYYSPSRNQIGKSSPLLCLTHFSQILWKHVLPSITNGLMMANGENSSRTTLRKAFFSGNTRWLREGRNLLRQANIFETVIASWWFKKFLPVPCTNINP